jgi:tripartite-type tricarboxylate transporter receptor subunit TctC
MKSLAVVLRALPLLGLLCAGSAFAQNYPTQPLRIIVPSTPGGTLDALARIVGGELQRTWAKPVTVDNRPGENGNAGTRLAAMAPPDGHTMLMVGPGFSANPVLGQNAGYDPALNFVPVSHLASLPTVAVVHPIFPAQNIKTLVEVLKLSPGQFSYGSAGSGTSLHLAAEAFKHSTKIDVLHVPFKNSKQAESAIVAGDVQMLFSPLPAAMPLITAGRVRPLAVSTSERLPMLLDVPTMQQAGVENFDFNAWFGIVVPANTPPAVVQKLSDHLGKIMRQPKLVQRLSAQYVQVAGSTPQQFADLIQKDQKRWLAIAEESKRAAVKLEQSLEPETETVESGAASKPPAPPKPRGGETSPPADAAIDDMQMPMDPNPEAVQPAPPPKRSTPKAKTAAKKSAAPAAKNKDSTVPVPEESIGLEDSDDKPVPLEEPREVLPGKPK